MKAVQIHEFGGPEVLRYEDAPDPQIASDEVLAKVYATGVNPIDWKIRKGYRKGHVPLPLILGWDFSGVVEAVGANVTNFKKGDAVFGRPDPSRNGTYAEYVAVKADQIALKPQKSDHIHTAAVPLAGLTAWQGVIELGALQSGQKILITGAAGGVGTYAVQFAKWKGAHVVGTASKENEAYLKDLGTDEVIDYHKQGYEQELKDLDVIFDTIGGEGQNKLIPALKKGGILVSTVGITDQDKLKEAGIQGKSFMAQSKPEDLKQLARLIDDGQLKIIVSKVLPLDQAAEAHRLSEQGHTKGKIVLEVVKSS